MRVLLILFVFIFLGWINSVSAYDLVLPIEKKSIVNTNYAFFVGRAGKTEEIFINNDKVYIASNGAFAHSVKLKDGENRIIVKSNFNTQVYKFFRENSVTKVEPEIVELVPQLYKVKKDNTPLRSTPIDYGMNRISHLFKDTYLIIDGKKGDFYRVRLSKNKEAWVAKDSILLTCSEIEPKFVTMNTETFKNASKHIIEFSEKLPYTLDETEEEIFFKVYNPFVSEISVYTINIKKPEKYSYDIKSENGSYCFKISELPKSENETLEDLMIVLDAGHGGSEKGAIGCLGDKEKDINLKIALSLKEKLSQLGANVVMTRECDGNVSLEDRVKIAQENGADIFISIHLNSIPDIKMDIHKNRGTSVYYYNKHSKKLAESLLESVTKKLSTRKDGVRQASFAVIRPTNYIGVLVEVAYMTNPMDSVLYTKESFPEEVSSAIADGVLLFVNSK